MTRQMKNSGIEWIGEIPADWDVKKTLSCLSMPITDGPHTTPELLSEGVPFVSAEAVSSGSGKIDFAHIRGYISEAFYNECCKKYIPQKNDIYMIKSGATTGKVAVVDTDIRFTIWSPLAVFRANPDKIQYKYLYYALQSHPYQKQIEDKWSFGTQQNIGMRVLEQIKLTVPPLSEQQKIADYLDEKCGAIDEVIAKTEQSIEEYKKLKQSVITEAVTKGVRPNRKMKDSGIAWIGEIPEDFSLIPLKYIAEYNKQTLPETTNPLYEFDYIDIGSVTYGKGIENVQTMKFKDAPTRARRVVYKDDVILSTVRTYLQATAQIMARSNSIVVSTGFITLTAIKNKVSPTYLKYAIQLDAFISEVESKSEGISYPAINPTEVVMIKAIVPPLSEQKEIADYLDKKCAEIDTLIEKKQKFLTELATYKKSMIYEYVTGKKEVA